MKTLNHVLPIGARLDNKRLSRASRVDKGVNASFYTLSVMLADTVEPDELKAQLVETLPDDIKLFHV